MIERKKYRKQQYTLEKIFACFCHGNLWVFTNKRKKIHGRPREYHKTF